MYRNLELWVHDSVWQCAFSDVMAVAVAVQMSGITHLVCGRSDKAFLLSYLRGYVANPKQQFIAS